MGPRGKVAATLEVVGTRALGVADMKTQRIWIWEARVFTTATLEEVTEAIMTTDMRHVRLLQLRRNKTCDPGILSPESRGQRHVLEGTVPRTPLGCTERLGGCSHLAWELWRDGPH